MMCRKRHEFRPDPTGSGLAGRLHLTKKERYAILRWSLLSLYVLLLSLTQDVIFCRVQILGATTDLVSCGILLICMLQDPGTGGVFALLAATFYFFTGTAPGAYTIALLPILGMLMNILRHVLLRRSFGTALICTGICMMLYELIVFAAGLFLGSTTPDRLLRFVTTGLLSIALIPLMYPVVVSIGKIGGESWKD
jgi:hypothetical protein